MTAKTGRSVNVFFKFSLEDVGGVMRDLPVNTIGGLGITNQQVDLTALQDAMKGWMAGHGDIPLQIGGPMSTNAAVAESGSGAVPALSGSHVVLAALNALGPAQAPGMFAAYCGMRQPWETGEPVFGIASPAATDGVTVMDYTVDPTSGGYSYTANLRLFPGSKKPTWGTALITVAA